MSLLKKHSVKICVLSGLFICLFCISGCGALLSVIIQALIGTKVGFVFVAAAVAGSEAKETTKKPGMIYLGTNNPPEGYKPLNGAGVLLDTVITTTGTDGSFKLEKVPAGVQLLKISHPEYVSIQQDVAVTDDSSVGKPFSQYYIEPKSLLVSVAIGNTFQFEAYGIADPNIPMRPESAWSVDGDIGTIDSSGIFTAKKVGTGYVRATAGGFTAQAPVQVVENIGTITGTVMLENVPVGNAEVTIANSNLSAKTDSKGVYIIPGVPSTTVQVIATYQKHTGFTDVTVKPGETVTVNVIELGAVGPLPPTATIPQPTPGGPTSTPTPTSGTPTAVGTGTATPTPTALLTPNTWNPVDSNTTVNLRDVYFIDPNTGWAVGDSKTVLKSSDGGANWMPKTITSSSSNLLGVYFVDKDKGYVLSDGEILYSSDGGDNWISICSKPNEFSAFSVIGLDKIWIAGSSSPGKIWYYDGNPEPTIKYSEPNNFPFKDIKFTDSSNGWALNGNRQFFRTTNGGDWSYVAADPNTELNKFYQIDTTYGWAVGKIGFITLSQDGWSMFVYDKPIFDIGSNKLQGVCFVDRDNGWAVGTGGVIVHTNNGTQGNDSIWSKDTIFPSRTNNLNSIYCKDTSKAWAVGDGGVILRYIPSH